MVLSIDNDGKRKRIPQYTMAAQSVSPELSWITWQDGSNSDKNRFYLHTKLFVLLKCYKVVRALSR